MRVQDLFICDFPVEILGFDMTQGPSTVTGVRSRGANVSSTVTTKEYLRRPTELDIYCMDYVFNHLIAFFVVGNFTYQYGA